MKPHDLKKIVKEKYSLIAKQNDKSSAASCCGTSCCSTDAGNSNFSDNYDNLNGYHPDADLGLGCGLPTEFARIKAGDTVVDLGSGAGNDCFVARAITGEQGRVIGLDMTEAMVEKAQRNAQKLGYTNVEFHLGDIEEMPLADNIADVVVSNCVLNLVPDKEKAFSEIKRVLKPSGHFCISDVVLKGELPEALQKDAEMYAGCVSGAIDIEKYLGIIKSLGFSSIEIHKQKKIIIPTEILSKYLTEDEMLSLKSGDIGIYSITVSGTK